MTELKPCPFCGGKAEIAVCDDEGNLHDEEYEKDAWSGLGYKIIHSHEKNEGCPIARYEEDEARMGVYIYDTRDEAIEAWNRRAEQEECKVVELPCKVGDTVYVLSDNDYDELKVTHILIGEDGIPRAYAECPVHGGKSIELCEEDYCGRECCRIIFSDHNDSRIRFTKEEAEKALKGKEEKTI